MSTGSGAWPIALRLLRRDWRSGELALLISALVLTVAAVSAVGFFTDRIEGAMVRQGGELIGGDLVVSGSSRPPDSLSRKARTLGLAGARTLEFRSVVVAGERPQLVQVKAVDARYPLRGELRVRDSLDGPERSVDGGPPAGEVWVEPRLLRLLDARVGDSVGLGESRFEIGAVLSYEPDRGGGFVTLAPRVMMAIADLPATGLVSEASRVTHRLLVAGEVGAVDAFADWTRPLLPANLELLDARDARPEFETAVDRASRFLHLATLVTLLVAGSAIALASRRLVERQTDAVAVMRCLGARRHLLARIFVLRLVLLALIAGAAGALLGWLAHLALLAAVSDLIATDLPAASWTPVGVGMVTGLAALLGFALPPLVQLGRVPPMRVLRRDLGPPRAPAIVAVLGAGVALALLVFWQAGDAALAWKLLGGVVGALVALIGAVLVLIRIAGVLAGRVRGVWRLGLAALSRRPGVAVLQVAGFGLGILALLLLAVVRVDLLETWRQSLPEGAPNHFLINIQPQEVAPLGVFLAERGIADAPILPMIRGRLVRIGEREVRPSDYESPRAEQLAAREFNLSYAVDPQPDNRIVAGSWWRTADAPAQFSVEEGIAETLGIALGDRLTFLVSGQEVSAPVTSLRSVRWDSFNVNFFVVSPPGLLGGEPASHITSFYLPPELESLVPELVRAFPSVTLLDVDAILGQVRRVVERGALAVEYVFLLTLVAGVLVMAAGIQASLGERRAEHAILRTLGAGRRALLGSLAVEFAVTGLLAGLLASIFAELIAWLITDQLFGLAFSFNPGLWLTGVLGSALGIGLVGVAATYPLLVRPPLQTLRRAF